MNPQASTRVTTTMLSAKSPRFKKNALGMASGVSSPDTTHHAIAIFVMSGNFYGTQDPLKFDRLDDMFLGVKASMSNECSPIFEAILEGSASIVNSGFKNIVSGQDVYARQPTPDEVPTQMSRYKCAVLVMETLDEWEKNTQHGTVNVFSCGQRSVREAHRVGFVLAGAAPTNLMHVAIHTPFV